MTEETKLRPVSEFAFKLEAERLAYGAMVDADRMQGIIELAKSYAAAQQVWLPISEANEVKNGFMRIYSFEPSSIKRGDDVSPRSSYYLRRVFQFEQTMGSRVCDLFMDIPLPPITPQKENG